jgi:quercetin dioxygenase-like cupin family protein
MMIGLTSRPAVALIGVLLGWMAGTNSDVVMAQSRTPLIITRIFTGADGQAQSERVEARLTPGRAPTAGSIDASDPVAVSQMQVLRTSPGYVADWHSVPRRQYVVMLRGQREIEVAGGKKVALAPGSVMLVEDISGKGHLTRGVGAEDAISLVIPIVDSP